VATGWKMSPLNRYCGNYLSMHCPGDLRTKRLQTGAGWAFDSYSKADGINGLGWSGQVAYKKQAEITDAASTFIFIEEADPRNYNNGTWALNSSTFAWVDPFAVFHGNWSTFSFADGHAEGHKWLEGSTIKAASDSARGISSFYWAGGGLQNRDYAWVHYRYRFVGWKPN
jgi:prepilin-type processing-associated H-X9-DG protein